LKLQNDMQAALAELRKVAKRIDPLQVETACQMIVKAGRYGGLSAEIRRFVHCLGGSGSLRTVTALIVQAKAGGATV
jgi:hypothetical protein